MTSKIINNNAKFLERTQKSINAEKSYYNERKTIRDNKKEYDNSMKNKSDSYAEWWVYEKGHRACTILSNYYRDYEIKDPLYINTFDKSKKGIQKYHLKDILYMMFTKEEFPVLPGNRNGQTRIWEELYISTKIYNFLYFKWSEIVMINHTSNNSTSGNNPEEDTSQTVSSNPIDESYSDC